MALRETGENDLIELCQQTQLPLVGIFARDGLPKHKHMGFFIINLDTKNPQKSQGGTHWVSMFTTPTHAVYFDSFGCQPPTHVLDYLTRFWSKANCFFNVWQCQDVNADSCGQWCIVFGAVAKKGGRNAPQFVMAWLNEFQDSTKQNELQLRKQFRQLVT